MYKGKWVFAAKSESDFPILIIATDIVEYWFLKYQRFTLPGCKEKGFKKIWVCCKNSVPLGRNKQIENKCPSEYPRAFNNGTQCCKAKKYSGAV